MAKTSTRGRAGARGGSTASGKPAQPYVHEQTSPMRPDVGTQAQFRKKKAPATYRYDSSLSPSLEWDGQHAARELGEWLLGVIEEAATLDPPHRFDLPRELHGADGRVLVSVSSLQEAVVQLKRLGKPFLNWTGKAERLSFDVPSLPLFIHERLSTKAIVETLVGHKKDKQQDLFDMFGDPQHSVTDQVLRAYEHQDRWVNRLILGDSLVVMNSLLQYEGLGGQVQMIYIDPPYGVKFGSNFQPFVRRRDVTHNDDEDLTREPEMVKAYRDTWELGLHSYLTYMRDRLLLARELLTPSGSVFVQISDENLHHVRELMDEVFGPDNFVVTIVVRKKGNQRSDSLAPINDYLLWFTKDKTAALGRFSPVFVPRNSTQLLDEFSYVELSDGAVTTVAELNRRLGGEHPDYYEDPDRLFKDYPGARAFDSKDITIGGVRKNQSVIFEFQGVRYDPGLSRGVCWKHTAVDDGEQPSGMARLAAAGRLFAAKKQIRFKRYAEDFPYVEISNVWNDVGGATGRVYVVQTSLEVVKRAMLMTTNLVTWSLTPRVEAERPPSSLNNGGAAGSPWTPAEYPSPSRANAS